MYFGNLLYTAIFVSAETNLTNKALLFRYEIFLLFTR